MYSIDTFIKYWFKIYDVYVDDGYSGLNLNRPGFQRMIQDIQGGKINLVITKDYLDLVEITYILDITLKYTFQNIMLI